MSGGYAAQCQTVHIALWGPWGKGARRAPVSGPRQARPSFPRGNRSRIRETLLLPAAVR